MVPSGLEWLRTGQITHHWSYFAAGGTSILTGLQLTTWCVLLAMADDLTSRPDSRPPRPANAVVRLRSRVCLCARPSTAGRPPMVASPDQVSG